MSYKYNVFTGTFDLTDIIDIGDDLVGGTAGSVLFVGAGPVLAQDNANFFWDDANNYLGVGTSSPAANLQINTTGTGKIGQIIKATASQTVDLQEWQDSSANILAAIGSGGSLTLPIETITSASDTLDDSNYTVLCDCTSNAITINLPAAATNKGKIYHIKKIDSTSNAVTVDGNSSETIDGGTTQVISFQYDSMMIICSGAAWFIT